MAKDKDTPTTVKTREPFGKTSNPTNVVFPLDTTGFTTLLRKEGTRAAGRMNGSVEKLKIYMQTLQVLAAHGQAKIDAQKATTVLREAQAQELRDAAEARAARDREYDIAALRASQIAIDAELDTKDPVEPASK